MPDYSGKAKRNTVHLQSSFFYLLGKLTSLRETFEVSTKANSPTRRKAPSLSHQHLRTSQKYENLVEKQSVKNE